MRGGFFMKRIIFTVAALLLTALQAYSLDVEQWRWGFDGRAVENRLTPLSIMVSNPSPDPFEGVVTLWKIGPMGTRIGASLHRKVFVGPFSSKWIQFTPFVRDDNADWRVFTDRNSRPVTIKAPKIGGPVAVLLTSGGVALMKRKIVAPPMPEHLFPPSAALTSGLASVVLDHDPEFTPLQTRAFLDWLKGGGKLWIVPSVSGQFPTFSGDLAALNFPGDKMNLENGIVRKLSRGQGPLTARKMGVPAKIQADQSSTFYLDPPIDYVFRYVRKRIKTHHNWGLIFFISLLYMALVTVGNYMIGRKAKTPLKPIAFFIVTVLLFSMLLAWCGKRGQGEKSQINSMAIAREVAPERFLVEQWVDVFATSGDYYSVSYSGDDPSFFSGCREENVFNATIANGVNGLIEADIPMFSSVQFYHAEMENLPNIGIESFKSSFDGAIAKFMELKLSPDFPSPILDAVAVAKGKFYQFSNTGGGLYKAFGNEKQATLSSRIKKWNDSGRPYQMFDDDTEKDSVRSLLIPLIIRSRGGDPALGDFFPSLAANDDKVDIYVLATMPDAMKCSNKSIKTEKGYVLFHFIRP